MIPTMGVEALNIATPSTPVRFVGLRAESVDAISWAPEVVVSTVASTLMLAAETRSDMSEALT